MWQRRLIFPLVLGFLIVFYGAQAGWADLEAGRIAVLKIYDSPIGITTRYIGACEGNINFDLADIADLNINTYRIYGGMSRWEPQDDDGRYGLPTIAQIKTDPSVIDWDWWDTVMTRPAGGSDYGWSGNAADLWQGSARDLFSGLKQAHVRPVLTLRNSDAGWNPDWALQLNPPRTEAGWNEWWEHVFATVYWLNVRNDYQVDDFEIHNEPDNREQGWGGTQLDYFELVRIAQEAISYVYATYLPDRIYHIHAPMTTGGSSWPNAVLNKIPQRFDSVNVHSYAADISPYMQQVHSWMNTSGYSTAPLWLGEWGTYTDGYDDLDFALSLLQNLIRAAQPGDSHVYGSHLFSLYDWGKADGFAGLINAEGDRRLSYYALRMGIRALQGGRPVLLSQFENGADLMAIATQDFQNSLFVLIVNSSATAKSVSLNSAELIESGTAKVWQISQQKLDTIIAEKSFQAGSLEASLPKKSAMLLKLQSK